MVTNYNGLVEQQRKLRAAGNVKSTKMALAVRKKLMAVEGKINEITDEISAKQKEMFEVHKDARKDIDTVNDKMEKMHQALSNQNGDVNQALYEESVQAILSEHPAAIPFYEENKAMIDSVLNTEVIVDLPENIHVDDLPDNLSCNDLMILAFMIDGLD